MDTKASDGNNLNTFDDDHHSLNKIENKIKDTVFGIVFALLKEQEISVHFSTVLVVIQMFQTIAFVFHETLAPAWNYTDITDVLYAIFDFFDLVPYIKDTNWNVYVAIMYLGIVAIFITLFLAFIVHYSFTRKKISFSGPVVMLRGLVRLFTTILFLPFINYFVSMLGCVSDQNGTQVHAFFSEQECWTGEHIIHVVFAVLGAIIFTVLSLVVCVIFYEYKTNSNDAGAKASARPNLILNIYQLVMIVCLTFLTDTGFRAILLILIFFGSGVVFLKFAYNPPSYDEFTIKLWSFLAAINFWGAVMAIFASILEDTLFRGSVIVWLVGIPFVGFIHLASRDSRVGLLLININKFQNGAEIQNQIRYVTKLIKWRLSSKKAATLLEGYIGIHKQSCNEEDCPLRQKLLKNNRLIKTLMSQDETLNEKLALLIQLLNKIYSDGLKRFPNDTSLRISYAFFLLEKMHNKQQALQELTLAEQNKPTFDEQFIIYRYKKLVEDEIAESQNEGGGLDVITEVTFQNHLYHLQANIEKSALLHMEFWSQLSDGNPDLAKLNDIGSKINSSVQYVEDYWVKLLKINSNNAKSMKLYGKYLIEIINDKATGETFIDKARIIANEANKKALVAGGGEGDGFSSDITPTVWISGEQEKFGIITTLNLSAASLFGYSKTELLNQKVDVMMPQIYARYHDSFLENYINNGEPSIIGKNKDRLVFGKSKSGYIFPVYMNIKANQSIIEGIQFIATFRTEKNFKNVAYVLTNLDGSIDSISASCINILKIDQKTVNLKKSNVQDYIPNVIQDRTTLFQNNGSTTKVQATLTVNYPKDSEYLIEDEELTAQVHCQCTEVAFVTGKQNVGYQFRLERVYEKPPVVIGQLEGRAKISNFQFKCERDRPFIVGEYVGEQGSEEAELQQPDDELLRLSSNIDQSNIASFVSDMKVKKEEEESEAQRINYGIGIKTLRLVDGKPQEIEDLKSDGSESDDEEITNNSVLQQKNAKSSKNINTQEQQLVTEDLQEDGSYRDFSNTFKSRKALSTIVGDRSLPASIKNLKIIANGLCIVLIAIAIADYVIARNDLDDIKQDVDLFDYSNQYLYEMMSALARIQDLYLLNIGVLSGIYSETTIRNLLTTALTNAKALKVTLDQNTDSLSADHQALLNNPSINLMSIDGTSSMKGLTQATEEVISRAFTLLTKDLSEIMPSQSDYYYLTTNLFNDYYVGLKTSANMYAIEMSSKAGDKNQAYLLLLIGSILALFVALLMCFPILIQVNRSKEEVLTLFLDIPERTVKGLYTKCEVFLSNLQIGEEDEIMSEIDADDLDKTQGGGDHDSAKELVPRKKRKHFKNSVQNQKSFFIQFFVIAALVEAYFLFNYITSIKLLNNFQQLAIEVNETSVALPFYAFTFATDKQLYINSSFPILGLTDVNSTYNLAVNLVKIQYVLDGTILEQHSIDRNIHTDTYIDQFNQMMMSDPCDSFVTITVNQTDCETFADSTISQGMSVAITRHFENLRSMLTCYASANLGSACAITLPTLTISGMTTLQNTILSLMASSKSIESYKLLYKYIKGALETLMINFKDSIDEQFSSNLTRRLIIFIVFVILVGVVYAFLWLALVNKISNDVWRTRSMLSMIPLNVIARIKSIRLYLKKFWNQRNVDEN